MYRAHVEASFESAHRNGPEGHKCAGTLRGVPKDVRDALYAMPELMGDGDELVDRVIEVLADKFDFHGHSWLGEIEWDYADGILDEDLWGPDFGKVKDLIRALDHHNLNLMFDKPSAEFLSKWLYGQFKDIFGFPPALVKLHEGRGNTMVYSGE